MYQAAPEPRPQAGEVLVRVHATAITPTEFAWQPTWRTRSGQARPFPLILGHKFSGVIAPLGPGVTDFSVGEAVYGMNDWFGDGAQAEYCVARPEALAPKPKSLSHAQAAVVPISALTAWQGLSRVRLAAGQDDTLKARLHRSQAYPPQPEGWSEPTFEALAMAPQEFGKTPTILIPCGPEFSLCVGPG
jgi:NADPH:quinone reductase-like Zn-dependent oxidoreductase